MTSSIFSVIPLFPPVDDANDALRSPNLRSLRGKGDPIGLPIWVLGLVPAGVSVVVTVEPGMLVVSVVGVPGAEEIDDALVEPVSVVFVNASSDVLIDSCDGRVKFSCDWPASLLSGSLVLMLV